MALKTFPGGIHPPDYKKFSKWEEIKTMPAPQRAVIFLSQHIGAPSKPIVQVGDKVLTGQKIAEAVGFVSLNQHSSISGKVTAIGTYTNPVGAPVQGIEIENDGLDEWVPLIDDENYMDLPVEAMKQRIVEAGICGMGGAGFPTIVKLTPPPNKVIDTLIVNGVECEPYLTTDCRIMYETPETIIKGLKIAMKILDAKRVIIGIEANKPKSIKLMKKLTKSEPKIKVEALQLKYPQGAEKQLVYATTRRKIPNKGGLPSAVGCMVTNTATLIAIYEAIRHKKPLIQRVLTVTGKIVNRPSNLYTRIGTKFSDLVDFCEGTREPIGKVISGGPMMGFAIDTLDTYTTKTSSGIVLLSRKDAVISEEKTCLRCGLCIDACPCDLLPSYIASAIKYNDLSYAEKAGAMDCLKCGCCSYTCAAHIKLVQWIEIARLRILEERKKGAMQ